MGTDFIMRCVCLAVGMVLGCLLPGLLSRRAGPRYAGLAAKAGESLAVLLAGLVCGVCYPLTAQKALYYGAFGAAMGAMLPLSGPARPDSGLAAVCVWLSLGLPVTGALCCLAGWALGLLLYRLPLGLALAPVFAAPIALIQYDTESAAVTLLGAVLALAGRIPFVQRRLYRLP